MVRPAASAAIPKAPLSQVLPWRVLPDFPFPGGLAVTGTDPCPRGEVPRGRELAHVAAALGDEDLRDTTADAGNGLQQIKLTGERAHLLLDPHREFLDRSTELIDTLES